MRQPLDSSFAAGDGMRGNYGDDVEAVETEGDDVEGLVAAREIWQAHRLTFAFPLSIVRACCH
jgi:hypothetical protein